MFSGHTRNKLESMMELYNPYWEQLMCSRSTIKEDSD